MMETATNRESAMFSLAKSDTRFKQVKIFQDWNFYDFLEVNRVTEFSDIGCAREWLCGAFNVDDLDELFNVREGGTVRDRGARARGTKSDQTSDIKRSERYKPLPMHQFKRQ